MAFTIPLILVAFYVSQLKAYVKRAAAFCRNLRKGRRRNFDRDIEEGMFSFNDAEEIPEIGRTFGIDGGAEYAGCIEPRRRSSFAWFNR
jgi:hypothetical protein